MLVSTLNSTIASIGLVTMFLFLLAVVLILGRTRSTYVLAYRLWRWATDRQEVKDPGIQKFLEDQHSLMSFRFVTELQARSLKQANALIDQIARLELDVCEVRAASPYLAIDGAKIVTKRLPARRSITVIKAMIIILLTLASISFTGSVLLDAALVQFKASRTWFLLSKQDAIGMHPSQSQFTLGQCKQKPVPSPNAFTAEERRVLCEAWRDPDGTRQIQDIVSEQRLSLGIVTSALLLFAWHLFGAYRQVQMAQRIRNSISLNTAAVMTAPSVPAEADST